MIVGFIDWWKLLELYLTRSSNALPSNEVVEASKNEKNKVYYRRLSLVFTAAQNSRWMSLSLITTMRGETLAFAKKLFSSAFLDVTPGD